MKKRSILTLSVLMAATFSASALTGNDLHDFCKSESTSACTGIISGTVRGFELAEGVHANQIKPVLCVPSTVRNSQLIDIVKNYLQANPSERHNDLHGIVIIAVMDAFPCNKKVK